MDRGFAEGCDVIATLSVRRPPGVRLPQTAARPPGRCLPATERKEGAHAGALLSVWPGIRPLAAAQRTGGDASATEDRERGATGREPEPEVAAAVRTAGAGVRRADAARAGAAARR